MRLKPSKTYNENVPFSLNLLLFSSLLCVWFCTSTYCLNWHSICVWILFYERNRKETFLLTLFFLQICIFLNSSLSYQCLWNLWECCWLCSVWLSRLLAMISQNKLLWIWHNWMWSKEQKKRKELCAWHFIYIYFLWRTVCIAVFMCLFWRTRTHTHTCMRACTEHSLCCHLNIFWHCTDLSVHDSVHSIFNGNDMNISSNYRQKQAFHQEIGTVRIISHYIYISKALDPSADLGRTPSQSCDTNKTWKSHNNQTGNPKERHIICAFQDLKFNNIH